MSYTRLRLILAVVSLFVAHSHAGYLPGEKCELETFDKDVEMRSMMVVNSNTRVRGEGDVSYMMTKDLYDRVLVKKHFSEEALIKIPLTVEDVLATIEKDSRSQMKWHIKTASKLDEIERQKAIHKKDCQRVTKKMSSCMALLDNKSLKIHLISDRGCKALVQGRFCELFLANGDAVAKVYENLKAEKSKN